MARRGLYAADRSNYYDALSPVAELVDKIGSRYQLVNLVAKRARELSAEAEEEEMPLERKAVSSAIDEVYTGKLSIEPKEE